MVTIVKNVRFSIGPFREIYQFPLPPGRKKTLERILAFFETKPLWNITMDSTSLRFTRGSRWASLFHPSESRGRQDVYIHIDGETVTCEFHCWKLFLHLQIPPSHIFLEAQRLENFLAGAAVEKVRKPKFVVPHPLYRTLYWIYRLTSSARYRARRRLTLAGWMVIIGLIGSLMMGSDTENTVIYQAVPILLFMLLTSVAFSWFFRARFSATRLLPRFGTVGRPFYYRVMVKNLTNRTQSDLTFLENLSDPRPSYNDWKNAYVADNRKIRPFSSSSRRANRHQLAAVKEAVVPIMPPKSEVEVRVELEPMRRGILRFSGITLARPDPFGLFRGFVSTPLPQTALILPKRYPLPPIALPGMMKYQEGGVAMASSIGRSEEFVSLREYRRGDPYRHIHWRSWAKTGKPIVKEFEDEFFVRHALVLDTFIDDPRSEAFEEAVSVAASFASTLISQESLLDLLFVGAQAYCFTGGRSLGHADQMLEILASVRVNPQQPFSELENLVVQHAGTVSGCICVMLAWDERRRKLVEKLVTLGVPTMVLLVVEPGSKPDLDGARFADIHVLEAGKIEEGLAKL